MSVLVWLPLAVSLSLSHTHIGLPYGFHVHFPTIIAQSELLVYLKRIFQKSLLVLHLDIS